MLPSTANWGAPFRSPPIGYGVKMRPADVTLSLVKISTLGIGLSLLLVACSSAKPAQVVAHESETAFTDQQTCASLSRTLVESGQKWPVGGQPLSANAADVLLSGFDAASAKSSGDLKTVLQSWTKGFRKVSPYLVANDPEGAERAITDVDVEIITLATSSLTTLCGWYQK